MSFNEIARNNVVTQTNSLIYHKYNYIVETVQFGVRDLRVISLTSNDFHEKPFS